MIMYQGGPYGRVKSQNKVFNIRAMQAMANRVANIALPGNRYSIFGKLREMSVKRYGNYGMANDPNTRLMPPDQYLGIKAPQLPIEQAHEQKRGQSRFETRDDLLRQQAGAASLSMPMMGQQPRPGIGSPFGGMGAVAPSGPQAAGNETVDDSGWNTTLSQIVGSGMLSQQQLQSASFNNVYSMINTTGMTESEKREMAFYMQRMILEGYVRGVDLVREIKSMNGGKINISLAATVCGGGADGCGTAETNTFSFRTAWWRNRDDKLKLALFYHEAGHALLNRSHTGAYSIMQVPYNQISGNWQSNSQYKVLMDELFNNSSTYKSQIQRGNIPLNQAMAILNGGAVPPGTPNAPTNPNDPSNPLLQPIVMNPPDVTNISKTFMPPNVTPIGSSSVPAVQGRGLGSSPKDVDKTPVAGTLPDMTAVHTFAAGLQEAGAKQSTPLGGLAGALTKFKHGA